jgi:hypothetical protein
MSVEKPVPNVTRVSTDEAARSGDRELYEADEHAWIAAQITALTEGRFGRLDRANLIEYLSEMTIRDRRELQSRLTVLFQHLLKLRAQPAGLTRSWVGTILEQQREIRSLVEGILSLGRQAETIAAWAWPDAVRAASRDTGIAASEFPATSAWTVSGALAFDPPQPATKGKRRD